ncbi:MAG: hypothetical protein Q8Q24_01180 [bacterium]|nr:hypothetical protein [bacterium]
MLQNLIIGIFLQISFFAGSFLFIHSFLSRFYSLTEKLIFTYLLTVANITIFTIIIGNIPQGITPANFTLFSQLYFLTSIIIFLYKRVSHKLNIKLGGLNLKKLFLKNKLFFILLFSFFIEIIVSIWNIYLLPIREGDTLAYHLQSAPNWFQNKSLAFYPSNDLRNILFPDNQNFLVLWNFLSFKSDAFIGIIPYSYLLLSVLVIFAFLQRLKNNIGLNFVIALLYYYVLSHLTYVKTFTGDIGVAALFFTSLVMLYLYLSTRKLTYFLFFSIANGMLLGIKTVGSIDIAIIYIFAFLYEIYIVREHPRRKILLLYLISILICLTLGGFQYYRNFTYFHNPFFPKIINIGPLHLPGVPGDPFGGHHGPNLARMIETIKLLIKNSLNGTFGYQFLLFYIPAIIVLFCFYRKGLENLTKLILSILVASTLVFVFTIAGESERYFFPLSFFGIISLASLIYMMKSKKIENCLYAILGLFVLLTPADGKNLGKIQELIYFSNKSIEERQLGEYFYDEDFHFFHQNIPSGVDILYLLPENAQIYPFYGQNYANRLIYANSDEAGNIINLIKSEKPDYFLAKSEKSDYNSVFYWWDFKEGKLIPTSEEKIKRAINSLIEKGVIQEIGTGSQITFYKIEKNYE